MCRKVGYSVSAYIFNGGIDLYFTLLRVSSTLFFPLLIMRLHHYNVKDPKNYTTLVFITVVSTVIETITYPTFSHTVPVITSELIIITRYMIYMCTQSSTRSIKVHNNINLVLPKVVWWRRITSSTTAAEGGVPIARALSSTPKDERAWLCEVIHMPSTWCHSFILHCPTLAPFRCSLLRDSENLCLDLNTLFRNDPDRFVKVRNGLATCSCNNLSLNFCAISGKLVTHCC